MINKTKCCFYEKTNKIGKPLATLIKGNKQTNKTERAQINKIRKKLQWTPQKYKGSQESTKKNNMPIK